MMEMTTAPDVCSVSSSREDVVERIRSNLAGDETDLTRITGLFALLGDPMRLRVVLALTDSKEICVCELATVLGLSMPATSHHLRRLREAGVVAFRNDGKTVWYRLSDPFPAGLVAQARVWARASTNVKMSGATR